MHIIAPNYTQIPNVVFDYWMNVLSHVEFKILLAICRKTFGWHKERDSLSIKQIMQMTGINGRSTVCNALKKLEDEGLIKKTKTKTDLGDDAPNKYEIDVRLLEGGSPTVGLRSPADEGGGSPKFRPGGSPRIGHTKESSFTKEKEYIPRLCSIVRRRTFQAFGRAWQRQVRHHVNEVEFLYRIVRKKI